MFLEVNGIKLYYEKCGKGRPLLLLHGNGEDHHIFDNTISYLQEHFTLYAVDTRGHGQSSSVSEFHYGDMAEDIYAFITYLELQTPIVYGFSDGGILGLILAIRHPQAISHLVISGANTRPDGIKPIWLQLFRILYTLNKSALLKLMLTEPDITAAQLNSITVPTFITAGSRDLIRPEHTDFIHHNIPHSRLKIFPHESHSSYIKKKNTLADYLLKLFNT